MRIEIKARNIDITDELRELVRRHIRFAFGRIQHRVHRVAVTLSDVNGPRGGVDQRCLVRVSGRPSWHVVVRDEDAEVTTALSRALNRAGRVVARRIDRQLDYSLPASGRAG
jgi:putative sigma-54 modulation protein